MNKPKKLNFRSYLKMIENSLGTEMFRNFYVEAEDGGELDVMQDGVYAGALYVSSVLVIFGKLSRAHATVDSTVTDLQDSGWTEVTKPQPGDVLVWESIEFDEGPNRHIGFMVENGQAVSHSYLKHALVKHDQTFDGQRKIEKIFRMDDWTDPTPG